MRSMCTGCMTSTPRGGTGRMIPVLRYWYVVRTYEGDDRDDDRDDDHDDDLYVDG